MSNPNAEQYTRDNRQDWEDIAIGWQKWHITFEKGAHVMSKKLIEMAEIKEGAKVLDIATGIGEPAIPVARCVGEKGRVLATDISPQMLSIARKRAALEHLEGIISFKEGDAVTMDLPESIFDMAICRLGLMFLNNLDAGLSNIYKSLIDGGRFAATVWATSEKVPQLSLAMDTIVKELDLSSKYRCDISKPYSLSDANILKTAFTKCGFKDIHIDRINVTFEFNSAEEYTNFTKDIAAPVLAILANQTLERKKQAWEAVTEAVGKYVSGSNSSIILDNEAICIVGKK